MHMHIVLHKLLQIGHIWSTFHDALTLLVTGEGAQFANTFFRWLFLHEKGGLDVRNFLIFPDLL